MLWRAVCTFIVPVLLSATFLNGQSSWEEKNQAGEKAFQEGQLGEANRLFLDALQLAQQFGPKDLRRAPIYNNLALIAFVRNNFISSEALYEKAISVLEGARGADDPLLLPILENVTRLYLKEWAFGKAIGTSRRICSIREKKFGAENPETALSLNQLATLYLDSVRLLPHTDQQTSPVPAIGSEPSAGQADEESDAARLATAEALYRRVLAVQEKTFGAGNSRLVDVLENLAEVEHAEGDSAQAQQLYARAIRIVEESFGREDLKLAGPLQHMGDLKAEQQNYSDAEGYYKRALHIHEVRLGPEDPTQISLLHAYAAVLQMLQRPEDTKKLVDRASLLSSRKPETLKLASQAVSLPYVIRFEKAVYDRYAGVQQTCMLVQADGRVRIEQQEHEGRPGNSLNMQIQRSPDGMGDMPAPQEVLDASGAKAHAPKIYESVLDSGTLQQLQAILAAKEVRNIQGSFPTSNSTNYYGTEKITASILRDDGVQNFAFPDLQVRQPFEETLRPLFKWLGNAEKRKGSAVKNATVNNCSPDLPPAVPTQFGPSRKVVVASGADAAKKAEAAAGDQAADEASSTAPVTTIQVAVNLVLARVVVRDAHGNAVGNLRQEDFQVFDNRKPATITRFSLEQSAGKTTDPTSPTASPSPPSRPESQTTPTERSLAYLFDDTHLSAGDLAKVRSAAEHQISTLPPSLRAAVFTTSGQTTLEFTADQSKLRETVLHIQPRKVAGAEGNDCPNVDTYMAELIWNKHDEDALGVATEDALVCGFANDVRMVAAAESMARAAAQQKYAAAETDSRVTLLALQNALRQLAAAPGQRTLVVISPGFLAPGREPDFAKLIEGALHTNIVISALDARGLYNLDSIAMRTRGTLDYQRDAATASSQILTTLTDSTGGTFFHNSNDLDTGLGRVSDTPEVSYVLGFSPGDQDLDGRFHTLSVTVAHPQERVSIQARKGYYATPRPTK